MLNKAANMTNLFAEQTKQLSNGNFSIESTLSKQGVEITQEQKDILDKEIQDALKPIENKKTEENEKAKATKQKEIDEANDALNDAQKELDKANTKAELYDYDKGGFLGIGGSGKFDYKKDDVSREEIVNNYKNSYYGVDEDKDGKIDNDKVHYESLKYDDVSDDEIDELESILGKDPEKWTNNELKKVDDIMEKMAKEAKKDTASEADEKKDKYEETKESTEAAKEKANEKYDKTVTANNNEALIAGRSAEVEIINNAVFGSNQEGAKNYFDELKEKQEEE